MKIQSLTLIGLAGLAVAACSSAAKPAPKMVEAKPVIVLEAPAPQPTPAEIEQIQVALHRVHFSLNSAKLLPTSQAALKEAAEKLKAFADLNITVSGHTDERGSSEYNQDLARRRAEAVVAELQKLGIAGSRLAVEAHGKDQPLVEGSTARAWASNRRVEFSFSAANAKLEVQEGTLVDDQGRPLSDAAKSAATVNKKPN
jgi:peptidoglycan-associated lipoprotein